MTLLKIFCKSFWILLLLANVSTAADVILPNSIKIGFLPTFSNKKLTSDSDPTKYDVGAIECAVRDINKRSRSSQLYRLEYTYNDTQGDPLLTIKAMTSQLRAGVHAFVGFEGSCETEAKIAAAWNVPLLTYVSLLRVTS